MSDSRSQSRPFAEVASDLAAACAWMQGHGIAYSKTRFGRYLAIFEDLVRMQADGELDRYFEVHGFAEWVNAAYEAAELIRIHKGLAGVADPGLVDRLRRAAGGRELFSEDDAESSGRDFSLELRMAASFAAAGMPVDLGEDGDLAIEFESDPVFLECKRPRSKGKLEARVKKGLRQLRARYALDPGARPRGILVISIGKLVNPGLGFLDAETTQELGDIAGRYCERFVRRHRALWDVEKDPRTAGVAVILEAPGRVGSEGRLYTCHQVTMCAVGRGKVDVERWLMRLGAAAFGG